MNGRIMVKLRGRDEEVRFIDHGFNQETGTQRIDWHFTNPRDHNVDLTDHEEQAIYDQIVAVRRGKSDRPTS